MLVRFLSYMASLIGSGRYKAILIACAILLVSVGGVTTAVIAMGDTATTSTTSANQTPVQSTSQTSSPTLPSVHKKAAQPNPTDTVNNSSTPAVAAPAQGAVSTAAATDVTLTPATGGVVITSGASALIVAQTSDQSNVSWTITTDKAADGITATIEQNKESTPNTTVHLHAETAAAPGTYTFTLNAKDAARNLNLAKTITLTVTQ